MASTNDQIDYICIDITKIMVKYPDLFPIVEHLKKSVVNEGHLRYAIERYCGLRTIVRLKNDAMMELWWSLPNDMYEIIKKVLLKEILFEYIMNITSSEDRDKVDAMFKELGF